MAAEFMLPENGEWVGPPVLYLNKRLGSAALLLDGSRRLKEHKSRGLKTNVPTLTVHSDMAAIKALIHNGHGDRAALHAMKYAPEFAHTFSSGLSSALDINSAKLQPYIKALKDPAQRHKLPRRAMSVVVRGNAMYQRAIEGEPLEFIPSIEYILGEFLDD